MCIINRKTNGAELTNSRYSGHRFFKKDGRPRKEAGAAIAGGETFRRMSWFKGISVTVILLAIVFLQAENSLAQSVISLDQVLQQVDQNNPALKVYESTIKSQEAKVPGAKAWMAPMVGAGTYMTPYPGTEAMDNTNKGALMITAEQDIPNPAKVKAKAAYLEAQSAVTSAERGAAYNELRAQAKQLYFDLLIAYRRIALQKENLAIMQNMKKLARIRYPYNQSGLNQIYKSEGRAYESENMIVMTEGEIKSKKIALNVLMNRPAETAFDPDTSYRVPYNPVANADTAWLAASRSDIQQMDRTIRAMQYNIDLVRKDAKPDFRIRFDHMSNYSGMMPAQFTLMGMVSIPIAPWSSGMYKSDIKSMNYEVQAMQQQKKAMLIQMEGMTRSMENDLATMQKQLDNYQKRILPALKKNLDVSMLSFQENKLGLSEVIDAWEARNMAEMNYLDQLGKFYQMIAAYEKNIEK